MERGIGSIKPAKVSEHAAISKSGKSDNDDKVHYIKDSTVLDRNSTHIEECGNYDVAWNMREI